LPESQPLVSIAHWREGNSLVQNWAGRADRRPLPEPVPMRLRFAVLEALGSSAAAASRLPFRRAGRSQRGLQLAPRSRLPSKLFSICPPRSTLLFEIRCRLIPCRRLFFCLGNQLFHSQLAIQVGVRFQQLLPGGNRAGSIVLALKSNHPQVKEGIDIVWIFLENLVQFVQSIVRVAAIVKVGGESGSHTVVVGVPFQRLSKIICCLFELMCCKVSARNLVQQGCILGVGL